MDKIDLQIVEHSGEKYPDMATAQRLALPDFVVCLEVVIRDLIDTGALVVQNGRIIPNPKKSSFSDD
jgi:hypothetical protein